MFPGSTPGDGNEVVVRETYRSPGFMLQGYLAYSVTYEDGTSKTLLDHRDVMQKHLGRELLSSEIVHHIDGNKLNNELSNLELVSRIEHARHHGRCRTTEYVDLTCELCGANFKRKARDERHNRGMGKAGPFCGKSCSARWSRNEQIRSGRSNLRS